MSAVFVSLDLIRLGKGPAEITQTKCPGCGSALDFHQPEPRLPVRLLVTCPDCFRWYVLDAEARLMALLPDEDDLRNV
jgi:hypothetical protein